MALADIPSRYGRSVRAVHRQSAPVKGKVQGSLNKVSKRIETALSAPCSALDT